MAAVGTSTCSTDFLFGDDFDAIFEALEENEEFEDYLEVVVEEYLLISRNYYDFVLDSSLEFKVDR